MNKYYYVLSIIFFYSLMLGQAEENLWKTNTENSLMTPISVTIGGDFIVNGTFTAFPIQRVDHLITEVLQKAKEASAGMMNQKLIMMSIKKELEDYSLRNIKLMRANGEIKILDLLKFRLTGDFTYNPYLLNDDVIIFPENNIENNFIDISGAVNNPTKFYFVEGDRLSDAILFARGIDESYSKVEEAEISRLSDKGEQEELIRVKIEDNPVLQRGDRVRILFDENYKDDFKVLVVGEVHKPGYIYITRSNSTLKEVIDKAGGFTAKADTKRSELIKGTDKNQLMTIEAIKEKYKNNEDLSSIILSNSLNEINYEKMKMARMADISVDDTAYFSIDNMLRILNAVGLVDFSKIYSDSTEDGNFVVEDGDIIVVPSKQNLVYVFGQVLKPGYTQYVDGKNYEYYISQSGGLGEVSDDIWIIRGGTREWTEAEEESVINPGDFIYIQKEVKQSSTETAMFFNSLISAIGTLATLVVVVINLAKL